MAETKSTACVENSKLYQHTLIEDPPGSSASADDRRQYLMLSRKVQNLCEGCPLIKQCLFDAVVNHDVAGFAGGTTQRQRTEIRQQLRIRVEPEDFDTLAGVTARHRQVDGDEVVRLRRANPHESLETLAHRLGCSLSTVKRHLRKARSQATSPKAAPAPRPTMAEVWNVYLRVVRDTVPAAGRRPAHTRRYAA